MSLRQCDFVAIPGATLFTAPPPPQPAAAPAANPLTVNANPFNGTTTISAAAAPTTLSTTFSNPSCPSTPNQTSYIDLDLSSYFDVPSTQTQFQMGLNWGSSNGRQVEFIGGFTRDGEPGTVHAIFNVPMVVRAFRHRARW